MFEAVLLGLMQGLTEFLPVSSSGHLVVLQHFLGFEEHSVSFDIAVHLGTILSILTVYRKAVAELLSEAMSCVGIARNFILMVILGNVPTAMIGLGLKSVFLEMFQSLEVVGVCFIITGTLLLATRGTKSEGQANKDFVGFSGMTPIKWWQAIVIGVAQGFAISPGISRSGSTIAAGLLLGLPRKTAALYSFMLSIPAIGGATILQIKDLAGSGSTLWGPLAVGTLVAYMAGVFGLLAILKVIRGGRLEIFTIYLWILGPFILFR